MWFQHSERDIVLPEKISSPRRSHSPAPWFTDALQAENSRSKGLERSWRIGYDEDSKLGYKTDLRNYQGLCRSGRAKFYLD